jgi:hypothetical protein
VTTVETEDKRAPAPDIEAAKALERCAKNGPTWYHRWFGSTSRYGYGASGRFNDLQHTAEQTLVKTKDTVEHSAWQTKVSDLFDNKREMPLIATTHSFSGEDWATVYTDGIEQLRKILPQRDFLIPEPTKDYMAVKPVPLTNSKALKIYRQCLEHGGLPKEKASKQTLAGWRVFMPELSYQAGVPRHLRQYLGRWANDPIADRYTRDHRPVIQKIWGDIMKLDLNNLQRNYEDAVEHLVPVDITDKHYDLDEIKPGKPVPMEIPQLQLLKKPKLSIARSLKGRDGDKTEVPHRKQSMLPSDTRMPADTVPCDNGGPLVMAGNRKPTGKPPRHKLHLIRPSTKRSVCGWSYAADQVNIFEDKDEWKTESKEYKDCSWCFRLYSVPVGWAVSPLDISTTANIIIKDADNPDDTDESVSALSGYTDDSSVASETEDESGAQRLPQTDAPSTSTSSVPPQPTAEAAQSNP